MNNVPVLHSKYLRYSGKELWVILMVYCQSRVLRRSCLNGLFGGTCRISHSQLAGNSEKGLTPL
jgi:hypothetical protein